LYLKKLQQSLPTGVLLYIFDYSRDNETPRNVEETNINVFNVSKMYHTKQF